MINQVLDDLFLNEIKLAPNEKIIWEGQPNFKLKQLNPFKGAFKAEEIIPNIIGFLFVIFFFFCIFLPLVFILMTLVLFGYWHISVLITITLIALFSNRILNFISRRNTKYFITNRKIVFQLWDISRRSIQHEILFSEIKNIAITEETENHGVIFLGLKNPREILFETKNLINGDHRHQITLELVDEVREVGKYIERGIKGEL